MSSAVTRWRRVIGRDVASVGSLRFEPGAAGARAVEAAVLILLWFWRERSVGLGRGSWASATLLPTLSDASSTPTKALRAGLHHPRR